MESLCGRKTEGSEELRKRKANVCYMQEVRWKDKVARFVATSGRKYKYKSWLSENNAGFGGENFGVKDNLWKRCESYKKKRQSNGNCANF